MIYAKQRVPFVQANLLDMKEDDPEAVEAWREQGKNRSMTVAARYVVECGGAAPTGSA